MSDEFVTEEQLAATYDGGAYDDATEILEQYRRATRYASRNDVGSSAASSALNIPRSRLRGWIDDSTQPDCVRGVETARSYGWLNCSINSDVFDGLNALVANIFSGGSIAESWYRPSFALTNTNDDAHIFDAIEAVGIDYQLVDDRDGKGDELRPTEDATVLGRVLMLLGAPVGPKVGQDLSLPSYLEDAPESVRQTFVNCYLENRAHKHNAILKFREERNSEYLSDLATLIEDVSGGTVSVSEHNIILSKDATRSMATIQ